MNPRKRTIIVIAALLVIVVAAIAFVIGRSAGSNDASPEPSTSTSSAPSDAPSTPAPEPTTEPEPTTPQDVSIAAVEGLLKGENTEVCKFFTEDADVQDTRAGEADVQTPMSQWCPEGEAYGHYEGVGNFAIVAEEETAETARIGLEFTTSAAAQARVGVSLVNVDAQWRIDRWCFYTGDYPDGLDSVLTCLDGDDA